MTDAETIAQLRLDLEAMTEEREWDGSVIRTYMAEQERWVKELAAANARCAELEKALRELVVVATVDPRFKERGYAAFRTALAALSATPPTPKWVQCTTVSNACLGGCASAKEHETYSRATPLTREEEPKE